MMTVRTPGAPGAHAAASAPWPGHALALGGYLLWSLAVLWPVLPRFDRAILGGPVARLDGWQNVWNLWWIQRAVATGASPFFSPYLFYPDGVDLSIQTLNASNGLLVLPITALFGPIAGYNAALLLALLLAALGGYLLALHVSGSRLAAFAGGLVFAFSPFHLTKIWDGQLELASLQWIAFYALFLLRAAERPGWRDPLLAGLFLALVGYTSWYYLLFTSIYSLLFVALWLPAIPGWPNRGALVLRLALAPTLALLVLAPALLPAMAAARGVAGGYRLDDPFDSVLLRSANLLDFWLPSYLHPLWGTAAARLGARWHPYISGWNMALGYGALALALLAAICAWRAAWRWLALAGAALLLALGPVLAIGPWQTGLWLPYNLLDAVPGANMAQRPSHFVVLATLALAPLAALGLRELLARARQRWRPWLALATAGLLAFEYAPPAWPLITPQVPPAYARLRGAPGAMLELPPQKGSSAALMAQLVHQMPLLGGYVSRRPPYPFAEQAPVVRELWAGQAEAGALLPVEPLAALNFYGVGAVAVRWAELPPERRAPMAALLERLLPGVAPLYASSELSLYRVPAVAPRPFAAFGAGWHEEEREGERSWRWMSGAGEILLANPTGAPQPIALALRAQSYLRPRDVALSLDQLPLARWNVGMGETALTLRVLLPPGEHRLRLHSAADREQGGSRRGALSIVITRVEILY